MWLQCLFRTGCSNCFFVIGSISGMNSPELASSMSIESLPCVFCDDSALSASINRCVFFTKSMYRFDVCALNLGCDSFRWSSNTCPIKCENRRKKLGELVDLERFLVFSLPDRTIRLSFVWPPLSQCHDRAWNHVQAYTRILPIHCTYPCLHHLWNLRRKIQLIWPIKQRTVTHTSIAVFLCKLQRFVQVRQNAITMLNCVHFWYRFLLAFLRFVLERVSCKICKEKLILIYKKIQKKEQKLNAQPLPRESTSIQPMLSMLYVKRHVWHFVVKHNETQLTYL